MPQLERITIYPIKSLDGYDVREARLLSGAGLEHDRQFAMRGSDGAFFTAKRTERTHRLRSRCDLAARTVELRREEETDWIGFHLDRDRPAIDAWLSEFYGAPIELVEHREGGFPDDTEASGPTIVGAASLASVAGWLPGLSVEDVHRRFRMNLVVADVEPFWEDRLIGPGSSLVRFRIGDVQFDGVNPCQRCPVPGRDPETGEEYERFVMLFAQTRAETLPAWAPPDRFDHHYRFTTNTRLAADSPSTVIRVGDEVRIG